MNPKDYLCAAALCFGKPSRFVELAGSIKWRYVIVHFVLSVCVLFVPVFILIVGTQPAQLYERVLSVSFENAPIYHNTESFVPERISDDQPAIFIFDDLVVYADPNVVFYAPSEFFVSGELSLPFGELFGMIAVYNMYIPQFLLPMLMAAFFIMLVLQLLFYLVSAAAIGVFRLASTRLGFGKKARIAIMGSLFPALISAAIGLVLPAVHIIMFQVINIVMLYFIFKRHGKGEENSIQPSIGGGINGQKT